MIILLLFSLLASDCRVHRAANFPLCSFHCNESGCGECVTPSHWLPCTVVEKCDTVAATWDGMPGTVIYCHPETTLVDSGVKLAPLPDPDTILTLYHSVHKPSSDDGITMRYRPATPPLNSAELADLREMLRTIERQMQFLICMDTLIVDERTGFEGKMDEIYKKLGVRPRIVRDSCECVYGDRKGK